MSDCCDLDAWLPPEKVFKSLHRFSYTFDASALAVFHYILPCHNLYEFTIQHDIIWRQSLRSIVCVLIKSGEGVVWK